jgi:hypothetical protein
VPPKVEPSEMQFAKFSREIQRHGFQIVNKTRFRQIFHDRHLRAPRKTQDSEVGFHYEENDLEVWVWTTRKTTGGFNAVDTGWVLITQNGVRKYVGRPSIRTKNFLTRLLRRAWVAAWRVHTRPTCKECGTFFMIVRGRFKKQRYWRRFCSCMKTEENPRTLSWNFNKHLMPKEAQEFLDQEAKEKEPAKKERKEKEKAGIQVKRAFEIRKTWENRPPQRAG